MSSARDRIFGRIHKALGAERKDASEIAAEARTLTADPARFQPKFAEPSALERFIAKATSERVTATLAQVGGLAEAPVAVAAYLDEAGLPRRIALQPTERLTALDWGGIETHHDPAPDETTAVSLADFGIAETGSVVFRSREDAPTLLNFVPLHHIVILETGTILPYPEDFWRKTREANTPQPRSVNIITGTSGTADIEAKNVRGAHGPRYMRIILVGNG